MGVAGLLLSSASLASQSSRLAFWEELLLRCPECFGTPDGARGGLIPAVNRHLVNECLSEIPEGKKAKVVKTTRDLCRKRPWPKRVVSGNIRHSSYVNYGIRKFRGEIHIDLKLRLVLMPWILDREKTAAMMDRAQACVPVLTEVFDRYGIRFNFSLDTPAQITSGNPNIYIEYRYETGRPNSSTLYYFNQDHDPKDAHGAQATFCETLAHEVGHMLGLEDEYEDADCPNREYLSTDSVPYSIMDTTYFGLAVSEFFPRHIEPILRPLCE